MKKQELTITIIDRRADPPEEREKQYTSHKQYLAAMAQLGGLRGAHVHEETHSTVTLYAEQTVPGLFE